MNTGATAMLLKPPAALSRLLPSIRRLCIVWAAMRARRADALALQGMSEHELKDLGIGRAEIPALLARRTDAGAAPWGNRLGA